MKNSIRITLRGICSRPFFWSGSILSSLLVALATFNAAAQPPRPAPKAGESSTTKHADEYAKTVRPLLSKFCLNCHSTAAKKGSLDLERFGQLSDLRQALKVWEGVAEQVEAGEMPPKEKPQPTAEERKQFVTWIRGFLEAEARVRAGDPGRVPLRRLSNAEYNATIRDLTGVDLRPARDFPADGAAGEGFTNAAEALTEISPTLLTKYLNAAKEIADRSVLLPDGFRFSPSSTRRDWTDEETARLRAFYANFVSGEGAFDFTPYLRSVIRHRMAIQSGTFDVERTAVAEKLNAKYLNLLRNALTDSTPSEPLDELRAKWKKATENDLAEMVSLVKRWQAALWKTSRIGSYVQPNGNDFIECVVRQNPLNPPAAERVPVRLAVKPVPGQSDVVIHLSAHELFGSKGTIVWHQPRFEGAGKPTLLLRDYDSFGRENEIDFKRVFSHTEQALKHAYEKSLAPVASGTPRKPVTGVDPLLQRWDEILELEPFGSSSLAKSTLPVPLALLEEKTPAVGRPSITGWRKKGTDLPTLVANSSDRTEQIPGRVSAHGVAVHPLPQEFVAVVWKSPMTGTVNLDGRIAHAHPNCGNGVAWWLELRHDGRAYPHGEGTIDLGKEHKLPVQTIRVEKGDELVLAVDARNGDHSCDMTEVEWEIREAGQTRRVWNLAKEISGNVQAGNPHADSMGNAGTWSFVRGKTKGRAADPLIPAGSLLDQWVKLAKLKQRDRERDLHALSKKIEELFRGPRPLNEKDPNRLLYDRFVSVDGPLFAKGPVLLVTKVSDSHYGLPKNRFGSASATAKVDPASIRADSHAGIEFRVPARLLVGREFVVDAMFEAPSPERAVSIRATANPPASNPAANITLLATPNGAAVKRFVAGYDQFRNLFPLYLCFPPVVPTDEVVSLKMFHREDEPLVRLILNAEQTRTLEKLWSHHRFVSRQPVAENAYLPQFIGFVTQDQPGAMLAFFESQRGPFQKRADEFRKVEEAAQSKQLDSLLTFASRAYRRPLLDRERDELLSLYRTIRGKGADHTEAFRGVLARILVSPAFLFRIERPGSGNQPTPVNDWELATRLSYFLWSSMPDEELRSLASQGQLHKPEVLAAQMKRMIQDSRLRSFAVEFGTQWIHVKGFEEFNEKNEKLFPTFDASMRKAMSEEAILFFQDFFQHDRPITSLLDSNATYLNESLARHYGIPGVSGPAWRRVEGVRQYGRGGILGLGSVQARQSGASRTSPILRGNWIVETLLGEKLPRPPKNVPPLPDEEGADKLTVRQQVERHTKIPECYTCHVRIDQFGFSLERYDAIGRYRERDLGGLVIDTRSKVRDGSEFDGLDGLRNYLLTKKKDVVVRLFCQRLLGYALGRAVTISDSSILDEMVAEMNAHEGRISAAMNVIVRSAPFRMIRGQEFAD
ncbi:MAG: DUF1592 domain-containing protein [Gemmataceae bacterium]